MNKALALKGNGNKKILSSYLKETSKQHVEVDYRIFPSGLFRDIF